MNKPVAKLGDHIKCSYRGLLEDGSEFVRTESKSCTSLCIGERKILPLVEDALIGLAVGESRQVKVDAEDGYGRYDSQRVFSLPLKSIPEEISVKRGVSLKLENGEGRTFDAVITSVGKKSVTVDANHPLAGNALTYEVTLLEIIEE